ncbi:hypothetical protein [Nitrosomonas communis]|uniref:hypothetical protein n=1 Tax=Nitrosomonas communis TaxID=44574 RepID=UPI003D2CED99
MTNHNLKPAIKERPILFSAPMVRAILDGRKTQTRRIVHPRFTDYIKWLHDEDSPVRITYDQWTNEEGKQMRSEWMLYTSEYPEEGVIPIRQLFGAPGDRLWVRENSIITPKHWNDGLGCNCKDKEGLPRIVQYLATDPDREVVKDYKLKVTPSIHMPRWASRINLEIINISVERLQDISEEDAIAEGCVNSINLRGGRFANENYAWLWDEINGKGSWDLNPWVWKIEFKRV